MEFIKEQQQMYEPAAFARQWLHEYSKLKINSGKDQILQYIKTNYNIQLPIKTKWTIFDNKEMKETIDAINITSMKFLHKLDKKLIREKMPIKWVGSQQYKYLIVSQNDPRKALEELPEKHVLKWDPQRKRVRLIGKFAGQGGMGEWKYVYAKQSKFDKIQDRIQLDKFAHVVNDPFGVEAQLYQAWAGFENIKKKNVFINEIPVLITKDALVCMPISKDEPVWAFTGRKRIGKSLASHGVIDRLYWKGKKKVGILRDERRETQTWCMPWGRKGWTKVINQLEEINEPSLPLPCVYLHPTCNSLTTSTIVNPIVGYPISLEWKHFIENFEHITDDNPSWRLGQSKKYISVLREALMEAKSIEEAKEIIEEGLPKKGKDNPKHTIQAIFESIEKEKILDLTTDIPSQWGVIDPRTPEIKKQYTPYTACLVADLVPILCSQHCHSKPWFQVYFRDIVEDLFEKQTNDPYFYENKFQINLFADEVQKLGTAINPTIATKTLARVVSEGGPVRLGFGWATQNAHLIDRVIYTNTMYIFAMKMTDRKQTDALLGNYEAATSTRPETLARLQKFEALGFTSEGFTVYDTQGNIFKNVEEPMQGMTLPSLSMHSAPT